MSTHLNRAAELIFNSWVQEGAGPKGRARLMDVNLIVMSRETEREIVREDFHQTLIRWSHDRTQPNRMGPARVAYDDTMQLGQMIVAEAHGDVGQ